MLRAASDSRQTILKKVKFTEKELGRGAYAKVLEVEYEKTRYAAKEIHAMLLQFAQKEGLQKIKDNFLNEYHIWGLLRHPCVVQCIG